MKIGILTLPLHINYGGILQAYALQTILKRMGHEVSIIEEIEKPITIPLQRAPLVYGKRLIKNILGDKFPIFYEQKLNKEWPIIRQLTDKFIDKYIHLAKYKSFKCIKEAEYDAIIVGSDQIWRPKYFGEKKIYNAYLLFTEKWKIKRIAYAASFGTDNWEYTLAQTKHCKELVKLFDAVSVREDSGVFLCKKYFGINATHVLDPTLLLTQEDYTSLLKNTTTPENKGKILNYILDESPYKETLSNSIAKKRGLTSFRINPNATNPHLPLEERIQPSVEQWLRGFNDAELVITDSFHACVFSILFKKQFVVFGNKKRGMSRFTSLLKLFNLEDRMIESIEQFEKLQTIDYNSVHIKLEQLRQDSLNYLKNI
jgi:hypothetical protein